jgi:hypothetical protein
MIESQGILVESFKSRRRRFARSLILQSILQTLTFAGAIAGYHYFAMPQLVDFARQDGWASAVDLTCPREIGKAGG